MSARQNKKQRKGRNNANNRERTVTTLTEDPNTPFLVPTSSEEPAGANLMSSPFSVASSSAGNPNNIPPAAYQLPGTFGFGYNNFVGPMHGNVHHQQHQSQQQPFYPSQQQQQQPNLPVGKNDLEILEKLKEMIKNGQHEAYKAIPQPAALANIYLGPHSQPQAPNHPEQASDFHHNNTADGPSQGNPQNSGPSSPADLGRRPPRIQSKDGWDPSGTRKPVGGLSGGGAQPINNVLSASSPDVASSANTVQFFQSNQPSHTQNHGGRYNQNTPAINTNLHGNGKTNLTGPLSAGIKSSNDILMSDANPSPLTISTTGGPEPPSPSQRSARFDGPNTSRLSGANSSGNLDQGRPLNDRLGHGESSYSGGPRGPNDMSPDKSSTFDGKDTRESGWSVRDGPSPMDDRRRDVDRPPSPTSRSLNGHGGPDIRSGPDNRGPPPPGPPRDDRYYDRDRERDRDRDRRDWDHRERDRRPLDRFRDTRMTDARRPPPEQRHYEPDYDRQPIPRRYDPRGPDEPTVDSRRPLDVRAPPTPTSMDDRGVRPPPLDDRLSSARAPPGDLRTSIDSRSSHDSRAPPPDSRVPPPDNRPVRGASFDDRNVKPSPTDDRRGPPPTDDRAVRASAPPARPADAPGVSRPSDDRSVRASPLLPVEDRNARPQVPLEERLNRPSLQDRLSQPPSARPETSHLSRQASLEERLSHPAVAPADLGGRPIPVSDDRSGRPASVPDRDRVGIRPGPPDERNGRGPPIQDDRARLDDRPGRPVDRYTRPSTPTSDNRSAGYTAPVARDDPRVAKPPSPPHRPASRDYRPPGRPISRERPDIRTSTYRPDERGYPDERRLDAMDIDAPPRYSDNRAPYNRPFSPPSAADLARDRARAQFPPSPPPARASVASTDPAPYDSGGRDWQYQQYSDRRREWSAAEEDNYWKSRPQWDRNNPPSDRERFERDVPPPPRNHGWDARDDRDRRDSFTRPASPRAFDGPPRPLSSRLTDTYNGPPSSVPPVDRSYPPRDAPPFNRVRQRSPSPVRRPGPGPGPIDDSRPPMKRPRDDAYPAGYYSPQARDPPLRRPTDYPSRGGSPPPPSSGSSYYDRGGPPPSSAGTGTSVAGDRDYPGPPGRDNYPPPASYDRPRSPGPARGGYSRGGYARGGDTRDDRRYPPPSMAPPPPRRP